MLSTEAGMDGQATEARNPGAPVHDLEAHRAGTTPGTVSLDLTKQHKPMIGVYRTDPLSWLGSKLLLRTRYRLLPNIIAGREICPEYIPHAGGAMPIVNEASKLITDSKNLARQQEHLRRVCMRFANKRPGPESAKLILDLIKKGIAEES
jgi:lipid-A-disaccharide synthase